MYLCSARSEWFYTDCPCTNRKWKIITTLTMAVSVFNLYSHLRNQLKIVFAQQMYNNNNKKKLKPN